MRFRHWGLRWLYFGLGLVGCMTNATGYLFWLESRRKKHARLALGGVRVVESLTGGAGDHLAQTLAQRHLWAVAGMDLLLLAAAARRRAPRRRQFWAPTLCAKSKPSVERDAALV